jgi:hypothetical protein
MLDTSKDISQIGLSLPVGQFKKTQGRAKNKIKKERHNENKSSKAEKLDLAKVYSEHFRQSFSTI